LWFLNFLHSLLSHPQPNPPPSVPLYPLPVWPTPPSPVLWGHPSSLRPLSSQVFLCPFFGRQTLSQGGYHMPNRGWEMPLGAFGAVLVHMNKALK
jgi:hypothetical protein